jgi:hypothetical protein
MAAALVLGTSGAIREGSSPSPPTNLRSTNGNGSIKSILL